MGRFALAAAMFADCAALPLSRLLPSSVQAHSVGQLQRKSCINASSRHILPFPPRPREQAHASKQLRPCRHSPTPARTLTVPGTEIHTRRALLHGRGKDVKCSTSIETPKGRIPANWIPHSRSSGAVRWLLQSSPGTRPHTVPLLRFMQHDGTHAHLSRAER